MSTNGGDVDKVDASQEKTHGVELSEITAYKAGHTSGGNTTANNSDHNISDGVKRNAVAFDNRNESSNVSSDSKKPPFVLGDRFFLLNWLHLWAFPLIHRCRQQKNIKKILLSLATLLTARKNGDDLEAKWEQEKANAAAASR